MTSLFAYKLQVTHGFQLAGSPNPYGKPPVFAVKGYPWAGVFCLGRDSALFGELYPVEPLAVPFLAVGHILQFDMCFCELDFYVVLVEAEITVLPAAEFGVPVHVIDYQLPAYSGIMSNLLR